MVRRRRRRGFNFRRLLLAGRRFGRRRPARRSSRRRKPLPWIGIIALVMAVFIISGFTVKGCTGNKTVVDNKDKIQPVLSEFNQSQLAGQWKGSAGLNEQKLAAKKLQADPAYSSYLEQSATIYKSTELTVDFKADGTLSYFVVSAKGANRATGTWKIVSAAEEAVLIEVEVTQEDGSHRKNRMKLQFFDEGRHVAMVAPTGPELSDCEPIFVFERASVSVADNQLNGVQRK